MHVPGATEPVYRWAAVPRAQVGSWNEQLLRTTASFRQYPYWVEPYRRLGFSPIYLVGTEDGRPCAYAAVLRAGLPGFWIGLIQNGPVNLKAEQPMDLRALGSLRQWARRHGFAFLRFSHFCSDDALERIASLEGARRVDAFPLYGYKDEGLLVALRESEEEMLASFQRIARRNIRAARAAGYEICQSNSAEDFARVWPLFQSLSERRGIHFDRPLSGWMDMVQQGGQHGCVRLYTARHGGKTVQAIVTARDGVSAEYVLGALDLDAMGDNVSPACLLQWQAMRDAVAQGCRWYDLGPRTSSAIYQFKSKFRPLERIAPPAVTLVTNAFTYALWLRIVLRLILPVWPRIRSMMARVLGAR
jgi:hypothetical protein